MAGWIGRRVLTASLQPVCQLYIPVERAGPGRDRISDPALSRSADL